MLFGPENEIFGIPAQISCGKCIGCRLEKSRQWAIRCVHEAKNYEQNTFITLTYNKANMPADGSLNYKDFQLFMKRLRKRYKNKKIRFYHCGEYGEKLSRPHYHAIIFNLEFEDKKYHKGKNANKLYTSKILEDLWGLGYAVIGDVTFESAAYVARYVTKKIYGKDAKEHYFNYKSGKLRKAEYTTMSRGGTGGLGGIGTEWYNKWKKEVYPDDFIIIKGKKMKPPKFYDLKHESENPKDYRNIIIKRHENAYDRKEDQTPERLAVREIVQEANFKNLTRTYETEL